MTDDEPTRPRSDGRLLALAGLALLAASPLAFSPEDGEEPPEAPETANEIADGARPGRIVGVVRFGEETPSTEEVRITQNQDVCGESRGSRTFVISPENKGLKNVLVTVEGVSGGRSPTPTTKDTIIQEGCVYEPHFQVAQMGEEPVELVIRNEDGILHNIHAYMNGRTAFNTGQPGVLKEITRTVKRPGVMRVECDVHGWMKAFIVFLDGQPYYAVSSEKGEFAIDGVPPGEYTLRAWHEALGEMTKTVTVAEGEATRTEFVITPGD